jgi:hypothetical protein
MQSVHMLINDQWKGISMVDNPSAPSELILNEDWLRTFCTYKQERSILHWAHEHGEHVTVKIEIEEGDEKQNIITLRFSSGSMITF